MNETNNNDAMDERIADKILVIEDDESLNILIQRRLNRAGFATEGMENGTDALNEISNNRYHLLLLDYTLPDMSGIQFAQALVDLKYDIPFIVITGQEKEDVVSNMMELGACKYLVKNNSFFDSLVHSVREVLGQVAKTN
jgi:DNA-binding NtrC family response regulator